MEVPASKQETNCSDSDFGYILMTSDEEEIGSLQLSNTSSSLFDLADEDGNDDISIEKYVGQLDLLFTNQGLDMAKTEIQNLETELQKQRKKLLEVQNELKTKEDDVAKIKLERDLADTESKLLKQQFERVLETMGGICFDTKDEDTNQHVVVHQFTPETVEGCEVHLDENFHNDIGNRLLDGWDAQEKLQCLLLNDLREMDHQTPCCDPVKPRPKSRPRYLRLIRAPFLVLRSKVVGSCLKRTRIIRLCKVFSIRRKWTKYSKRSKYQVMYDDNETIFSDEATHIERNVVELVDTGDTDGMDKKCLVEKIVEFGESHRKCIQDACECLAGQKNKINSLQRELSRLMSFQMISESSHIFSVESESSALCDDKDSLSEMSDSDSDIFKSL